MSILKILFIAVGLSVLSSHILSGAPKYPVNEIPESLREKAKVVVRRDETTFEVKSENRAEMTITRALTVLNENGIDNSEWGLYYDSYRKIRKIKAIVYDQNGNRIKRIPGSDILDISAISGYNLYSDYRVKYVDPEIRTVPYTVEYTIKIVYKGLLSYPNWQPYSDYNVSVEKSQFQVIFPANNQVRYMESNFNGKKTTSSEDDMITHTWDTTRLEALTHESKSPPLHEFTPVVYLAPNDFEIDGYKGNASTWQNFGKWINTMNANRQDLPEETKKEVQDLIEGVDDPYEKVKVLYQYMQNKTRYVSIQVGIGGWQPFPAEYVDNKSYGDCKALSNYMQAILQVAGIESYYTLVKAGHNASHIRSGFPSNQFNHAILCVPNQSDTLWLECTSQKMPCGYIGDFTDDRDVLLITPEGGELVHTKKYMASENLKVTRARVLLGHDGNAMATTENTYKGLYYNELVSIFSKDNTDKKKFMERRNWSIADYNVKSFDHTAEPGRIPLINEEASVEVRHFVSKMGNAMLFTPNMFNKVNKVRKLRNNRKRPVYIRRAFTDIDSIEYELPDGFVFTNIPETMETESIFGKYTAQIKIKDSKLLYIRKLTINEGRYEPEKYKEYYNFFDQINRYDQQKIAAKQE